MLDDYQDQAMVGKSSNGHISSSLDNSPNPLMNKNLKLSEIQEQDEEGEYSMKSFHNRRLLESKLQPKYSVIEEEDANYEDDTPLAFKDLRQSTVIMRKPDGTTVMRRVPTEDQNDSYNQLNNRITKINDTIVDTEENETYKDDHYLLTME